MSDFWSDSSSTSILHVCEQRKSAETAHMRRLAWAFAGRLRDKYHNLMSWLKCVNCTLVGCSFCLFSFSLIYSQIWSMLFYHRIVHPKDADQMANSVGPDQTALDLGLHYLPRPVWLSKNLGSLWYSFQNFLKSKTLDEICSNAVFETALWKMYS